MEERIIDDEYGRGIRLKKTKDGYIDATDPLAEEVEGEEIDGEEVVFEFPEIYEDDEELAALMPEDAAALLKKREEARKALEEGYQTFLTNGNKKLEQGDYDGAAREFDGGMKLVKDHSEAAVGYWRAKTENFTYPGKMVDYYAQYEEEGYEEFLADVQKAGEEQILADYRKELEGSFALLKEEKAPLEKKFYEEYDRRADILENRKKTAKKWFWSTAIPAILTLLLAVVFFTQVPTRLDRLYLYLGIGASVVFAVIFFLFIGKANKYLNVCRMIRLNDDLYATEEGATLAEMMLKEEFYEKLLG